MLGYVNQSYAKSTKVFELGGMQCTMTLIFVLFFFSSRLLILASLFDYLSWFFFNFAKFCYSDLEVYRGVEENIRAMYCWGFLIMFLCSSFPSFSLLCLYLIFAAVAKGCSKFLNKYMDDLLLQGFWWFSLLGFVISSSSLFYIWVFD